MTKLLLAPVSPTIMMFRGILPRSKRYVGRLLYSRCQSLEKYPLTVIKQRRKKRLLQDSPSWFTLQRIFGTQGLIAEELEVRTPGPDSCENMIVEAQALGFVLASTALYDEKSTSLASAHAPACSVGRTSREYSARKSQPSNRNNHKGK